jgi:hypothetical protein
MTDRSTLVARILLVWDEHGFTDPVGGGVVEMAQLAVDAIQCGAPHPHRDTITCTDEPHETGPVWHRNTSLGLEWSPGSGVVRTVHDALGPVELVPSTSTADDQPGYEDFCVVQPRTGKSSVSAEPRGRYRTLPHPGGDQGQTGPQPDPYAVIFGAVVETLDAASAKLRKLHGAYKGSATRGASTVAETCETVAASLRDLIGEETTSGPDEEGPR